MARRLWPESTALHRCSPMVLASITLWMILFPLTMSDTLLTSCTMLALPGVLRAEAGYSKTGWLMAGAAMGIGILAKGPVVLVHVMPAALLYGQTAGRIVNSFAHRHPFWWYLPFLPFCLQPWISFGAA